MRCDGDTTRGQCTHLHHHPYLDDDDGDGGGADAGVLRTWSEPHLTAEARRDVAGCGWLWLPNGDLLCPAHVTGRESMVVAALEGLPFPDTTTTPIELED